MDKPAKRQLTGHDKPQSDKFKDAARKAECDESEGHWTERLKKIATQNAEKPE